MKEQSAKWRFYLTTAIGLGGAIWLHYQRTLDWYVQGYLMKDGHWLIDDHEPFGRILFYSGPKGLLIALGLLLAARGIWAFKKSDPTRWGYLYILLCLSIIPFLVSLAKMLTNEPCPGDLFVFFGSQHLENLHGECFPGGHASGGFALLSLYWCSAKKARWFLPGLILGVAMGAYQMAKGAHFLSDSIASFFIAMLIAGSLAALAAPERLRFLP